MSEWRWFPYMGWKVEDCWPDGMPCYAVEDEWGGIHDPPPATHQCDLFVFEWLWFGFAFMAKNIRPK